MLPGKKYTPEDYFWIVWTRKWFILIPAVLAATATFTWTYFLPNRYRAETTVLVIPQRVPQSYVQSTVTADVSERLTAISQQILSRTRLERIIEEFNLYPIERQAMPLEDVVQTMRQRDVKINIAQPRRRNEDSSSFVVSFESSQPRTAMQVAERLASMFVQENLQVREVFAESTQQFLQTELADARRRLIEHEKKLEDFRRTNAGRLPSQAQANLQMMQTAQLQLQANADGVARDRERLQTLETGIAAAEAAAANTPPVLVKDGQAPPGTAVLQLDSARAVLRNLELRLKPEHPDVGRAKRLVAELEQKAEVEALAAAVSPMAQGVDGQSPAANRVTAMKLEMEEVRGRLEARRLEEIRLRDALASYTARLEAAPALESAVTELMRDYSTLQEQYTTLLRKGEESKIAVNLERRQIGEQFRVIDNARVPERHISPDRKRLNFFGLMGGLAFGVMLVGLLEYRDTTLNTDDDVVSSLAMPVLAVVPLMVTRRERQRRRRHRQLALSASLASLLLAAAALAWRLQLIPTWIR
ncbi:MAG: GumC family protein [Acidobacteriota bacterium]